MMLKPRRTSRFWKPAAESPPSIWSTVVARESPHAVYDQALASFGESGGLFSQQAAPGFIELWSLQSRMAYRLREERGGGE